ncbi:acyltransferase [Thermomonas brevis]
MKKDSPDFNSGRKLYAKWKPLLLILERVLGSFPKSISCAVVWPLAMMPGNLGCAFRIMLLRFLGAKVGDAVYLARSVVFKNPSRLVIGDRVSIHEFCYLDAFGGISIGSDVAIAHSTSILSSEHTWTDRGVPIKYNALSPRPVVIDDDVWIGCGVRVLGGVRINRRTVIAAGSVVKGEVLGEYIYGGVPAKPMKRLGE